MAAPRRTRPAPELSDLVDVEAPPKGDAKIDTPAYAVPPEPEAPSATPDDLIDVEAPPPGATPATVPEGDGDLLDRAADALLALAAERRWDEVTLRDAAERADVSLADLYARAPGKSALLLRLSRRLDSQALERIARDDAPSKRDRLFEALMSRLEVMEPHRDALLSVGRAEGLALAPALPRTVRALLEGAGIDTGGWRGALRVTAMSAVWARTLAVWRDDEGAYNRTMAEIDRLLTRADERLARVGAGF